MSVIHVLSAEIAGRIAAGEVIERPASVVKELVENSIDAGATKIRVHVEQGGQRLIHVTDNGCGMDRQDALMCLEAHATSKLTENGDVGQIFTLGFRGEAIPSIASVSQFQLQTRRKGDDVGTEVIVDNGIIRDVTDCGCAPGTSIKVGHLFGNLPARRKFLKSANTEEGHIEEMILMLSLARPDIAFTLSLGGREVIRTTATSDIGARVMMLLGREVYSAMLPVDYSEDGIHVRGFVSRPGHTRTSRREQRMIINGRSASAETLYFAIREAYDTLILKGRYPEVILYVDMAPERVDVNVHPAKREVRFREPRQVGLIVAAAIRKALRQMAGGAENEVKPLDTLTARPFQAQPQQQELSLGGTSAVSSSGRLPGSVGQPFQSLSSGLPQVDLSSRSVEPSQSGSSLGSGGTSVSNELRLVPVAPPENTTADGVGIGPGTVTDGGDSSSVGGGASSAVVTSEGIDELRLVPVAPPANMTADGVGMRSDAASPTMSSVSSGPIGSEKMQPGLPNLVPVAPKCVEVGVPSNRPVESSVGGIGSSNPPSAVPVGNGTSNASGVGSGVMNRCGSLQMRGRLSNRYVLAENNSGLVIVDIRHAHQRIVFERLLKNLKTREASRQQLLLPVTVELSPTDAKLLKNQLSSFDALGFSIEEFGGNSYLVTAVPASYPDQDLGRLLRDMLSEMREMRSIKNPNAIHLAQVACRHAVSPREDITDAEVRQIVMDLLRCEMPYADPSGNATMIQMTYSELEKRFKG